MSAGGSDKQIKFQFEVDKRSFETAVGAIRQLKKEIRELGAEMAKTSGPSGLFGGGGSGITSKAGGVNAAQQSTVRGVGVATPFVNSVLQNKNALKAAADGSRDTFRVMSDGLRNAVRQQTQYVGTLENKLKSLTETYSKLKAIQSGALGSAGVKRAAGALGSEADLLSVQKEMADVTGQHSAAKKILGRLSGGGVNASGKEKPSFFGGLFTKDSSVAKGAGTQLLEKAGSAVGLGGLGAAASLVGGIALLATSVNKLVNAGAASNVANAQYEVDLPLLHGRRTARVGGSVGQLGLGIRNGDLASAMAFGKLTTNGNLAALGQDEARQYLVLAKSSGQDTAGSTLSRIGQRMGAGAANIFGANVRGGGDEAAYEITRRRLSIQVPAEQAEAVAEAVRNEVASHPLKSYFENQIYGQAQGNVGMARTAGIGLGVHYDKNGTPVGMNISDFQAMATKAGYDPGAVAGAYASTGRSAGRGLRGFGMQNLGLQYAGFDSGALLEGLGAQFGGGGAGGARALLSAGITGGTDATAASQLSQLAAKSMTSGNFTGSGVSLTQMLMSAAHTGTPGGDMYMSRVLQAGMGEYGRMTSGSLDPLQRGINLLGANAAGVNGWYAKKALFGMDPGQLIDAQRSGKMPWQLARFGITPEQLKRYTAFQGAHEFDRFLDQGGGANGEVGRDALAAKNAGGAAGYLRQLGVTATSARGRRVLQNLALARQGGMGGTVEGNLGSLYAEMGLSPDLIKKLTQHRLGAVSIKGTIEGGVAQQKAENIKQQAQYEAENIASLKAGVGSMNSFSLALAQLTTALSGTGTRFEDAISKMTDVLVANLAKLDPAAAAAMAKRATPHRTLPPKLDPGGMSLAPGASHLAFGEIVGLPK